MSLPLAHLQLVQDRASLSLAFLQLVKKVRAKVKEVPTKVTEVTESEVTASSRQLHAVSAPLRLRGDLHPAEVCLATRS